MTLYCEHCNTPLKYGNQYPDGETGHWEYVDIGYNDIEIWYCCHLCRDNNNPCETFFPCDVFDKDNLIKCS